MSHSAVVLAPRSDLVAQARALVAGVRAYPAGQLTPSVYETARLVALHPGLVAHDARVRFLLATQRDNGAWGGAPGADRTGTTEDGYWLVPTLSATDALLTQRDAASRAAARRGVAALVARLPRLTAAHLPDTPAIELIVPALIAAIGRHRGAPKLPLPAGIDDTLLTLVRAAIRAGQTLPEKLMHCLEVVGPLSAKPSSWSLPVMTTGVPIGGSPAATAAWAQALERVGPGQDSGGLARYLAAAATDRGGPVPSVLPITVFEQAWVLTALLDAGLPVGRDDRRALGTALAAALGEAGTPGGAGLPPDADTTSATLYTLERLGRRPDLDCLLGYDQGSHFATWHGERTTSVSTNAHVLDAFGVRLAHSPQQRDRYGSAVRRITAFLCEQQHDDGSWRDKWHASPYYATMCCVAAMSRFPTGARAVGPALRRSARWALAGQRSDGGWGRWVSTAEETAYALGILRHTGARLGRPGVVAAALTYGLGYLATHADDEPTALWHDKDLYAPIAVVRAVVLAARYAPHALRTRPPGLSIVE